MKRASTSQSVIPIDRDRPLVFSVRGLPVMLDAHVAAQFGVATRAVNQAVNRNPRKFGEQHCFRLSKAETAALKSQIVISNGGRGGFQGEPMVYTVHGVARLATVLTSPAALQATDLIIDTFLEVRAQIAAGRKTVAIASPSRLVPDDPDDRRRFGQRLRKAMNALLDVVIDVKTGASVRQTAGSMTADALEHLRERLRTRGLENEKLAAETLLILKQAELVAAQARQANAEADGIDLKNLETRIRLVKDLMAMHEAMQPPALITMLDRLSGPQARPLLEAPRDGSP